MPLDVIGLALGLLLGAPGDLPFAPDHAFHPRERAVGDWRWQAAADLDASPGTRAAILLGRDPAAVTRCVRLNNYWCVKRGGWSGEIAADADGHVAFASAAEGATVAALLLRRYYVDYGRHSATAIVSRWAPASCGGPAPRPAARRARPGSNGTGRRRGHAAGALARVARAAGRRLRAAPRPRFGGAGPADRRGAPRPHHRAGPRRGPGERRGVAAGSAGGSSGSAAARPIPCGGDAVRIAHYAARAAAGIAASPGADLDLFDAAGRPTPRLAELMRNMAAVEIGPLGAGQGLVDAAVARMSEIVAARRPAGPAPVPAPGAAAPGRIDEGRRPEPHP